MSDEDKNPQNPPIEAPNTNLTDQKSSSLNSKKITLIIFSIVLFIVVSVSLFMLYNRSLNPPFFPPKFTKSITPQTTSENKLPVNPTESSKPTILPFPTEGNYVKNQLIVQYREGKSPADLKDNDERSRLASALSKLGVISQEKLVKDQETNLQNYYVLTFSEGVDIKNAAKGLAEIPEVYTVEPNASFSLFNK